MQLDFVDQALVLLLWVQAIYDYFDKSYPGVFSKFDDLYPVVTTRANFDEVLLREQT
jgi:hypothetical protein